MHTPTWKRCLLALAALSAAGCGGGGDPTYTPPDLILTADATLPAGTYAYSSVFVPSGVTLYIDGLVQIRANTFEVDGTVDGVGAGYAAGPLSSIGTGPGGGTYSTGNTAGAGGGSHGGTGGTGGLDVGDTPGTGGPTYGTATSQTIEAGSAGGSSDSLVGGSGGAALSVTATSLIDVSGTIDVSGAGGAIGTGGRGGGGGAGGGILLVGGSVTITGGLYAAGGDGSPCSDSLNDSGGGGGGGRIKVYHQGTLGGTPTIDVSGGAGGPFGTGAPGQPGEVGSQYFEAR